MIITIDTDKDSAQVLLKTAEFLRSLAVNKQEGNSVAQESFSMFDNDNTDETDKPGKGFKDVDIIPY